jgi:hypothetical protein
LYQERHTVSVVRRHCYNEQIRRMTRRTVIAALAAISLASAQKKSAQSPKGPDIELIEAAAQVEGSRVNIDGRVKNSSERPIKKMIVIFEMLDPSNNVLTKQQGPIEEAVLEPGDEGNFHAQIAWHARAHAFRVSFEDGSGRDLRAEKTGPFPIE